jgi:hypothetical protein
MNSDERERRWREALQKALKASQPPVPDDLKASLKRRLRPREAGPRWLETFRAGLSAPWAWGAGAAFAAAAALLVMRVASPPRAGMTVRPPDAPATQAALAELWDDDDGGDTDEG